ncbi:hypothetical protein BGZ83_005416 [Gryganskiella cystojenkinii]|nr:hypothetical protein BGZ83_005416 [Gryganskiella cystojenkinii]
MSPLNPIVYIPPTVLVLAIGGILAYHYQERIYHVRDRALWRVKRFWHRATGSEGRYDRIRNQDIHEAVQDWRPGQNPGLGRLEDEDFEFEDDDDDVDEEEEHEGVAAPVEGQELDGELMPEALATTTTSARLRMHHEMVQQMRARAGFAPEPFPGDEPAEGEEGEDDDDDEDDEEGGGAGSSQSHAAGAHRIRKIGKKKAEKLQRKEQMRAYREWMDAQREERRQQEEMFKVHEAALQEERQRKRAAQIEKDRQRKEALKKKELKDQETKMKQTQVESQKDETVRKELLAYIQRIKSFRLADLAKRLGRTEAQLLKDLAAIAQESSSSSSSSPRDQTSSSASILPPPRIVLASGPLTSPTLTRSKSGGAIPTTSASSPVSPQSPQLLILYDSSADQYVVLNDKQLRSFAEKVQGHGRINTKEMSIASQEIFKPSQKH